MGRCGNLAKLRNGQNNNFSTPQSLLIALLVERISLRTNEIFWCELLRANRPNTCSESSVSDFHSRMKSTFLSFSRLPILYHRRREFDGWKSPLSRLSCCYSRTQHTAAPCSLLCKRKTLRHREIRENGSPVLTSQTAIPRLPPCTVLYRTGSEISRICRPQMRGRKIDRKFIFSIFIREKHGRFDEANKKHLSYTL